MRGVPTFLSETGENSTAIRQRRYFSFPTQYHTVTGFTATAWHTLLPVSAVSESFIGQWQRNKCKNIHQDVLRSESSWYMDAGSTEYLSSVAAISCSTASLRCSGCITSVCLPNDMAQLMTSQSHRPPWSLNILRVASCQLPVASCAWS